MCIANKTISTKVQELVELRRMADELQAEIDALTDEIKAYMGDEETLTTNAFKVSWKNVTSTRLDTVALKKALPDVAARFTKTTVTRRFSVC